MAINNKLIGKLKSLLRENADATAAPKMQSYMKSSLPFYGVKTPQLRQLCKTSVQQYPLFGFDQWRDTVLQLWRKAKYREERYCAIELCEAKEYLSFQTLDTLPLYEEIIVTGAWWDYVDPIATHRLGYLLKTYPKEIKTSLRQWSKDKDLWKRRAAIICQILFKEETDLKLLYACIKPSLDSEEFFLQKAIGWALRSYAWHDIGEVNRYVKQNQNKLSPLSQREALKNRDKLSI